MAIKARAASGSTGWIDVVLDEARLDGAVAAVAGVVGLGVRTGRVKVFKVLFIAKASGQPTQPLRRQMPGKGKIKAILCNRQYARLQRAGLAGRKVTAHTS